MKAKKEKRIKAIIEDKVIESSMSSCDENCIKINFEEKEYSAKRGIRIIHFLKEHKLLNKEKYISAILNNRFRDLNEKMYESNNTLELVSINSLQGQECYKHTLTMIMAKAVKDLYPKGDIMISHSLNKGLYGKLELKGIPASVELIKQIEKRMKEIIEADIEILTNRVNLGEAIEIFRKSYPDKVDLLIHSKKHRVRIYQLEDYYDYYYGPVAISTGFLSVFSLEFYKEGFLLKVPDLRSGAKLPKAIDQPKLFEIYKEYTQWSKILGIVDIGDLNDAMVSGEISDIIKISETFHEKKLSNIADTVKNKKDARIVLIAGPSSSGKTSFAKRLCIHLRVNGIRPVILSLDDYFLDREKTPRDEQGDYDFENIEALDLDLLNRNLTDLLSERSVEIPTFDFKTGKRYYSGEKIRLEPDQILLIEGIHGLNDRLTKSVPAAQKFKIYVSALTQLNIDSHNRIPTTDLRLIRRMVRDHQFRGYSAIDTFSRWPKVRHGEEKWIFPHQENADIMFNSSLIYEFAILKRKAEPILKSVSKNEELYKEARRLLKFMAYFLDISDTEVPPTSILREFVGRSAFDY